MVKLKRLKILKFRNVAPGTELRFRDSLNVLLGKNGTGKTTLLNLVVALLRWDFTPYLSEQFSIEYDLQLPDGHIAVRLHNEPRYSLRKSAVADQAAPGGLIAGTMLRSNKSYETSGDITITGAGLKSTHIAEFKNSQLTLKNTNETAGTHDYEKQIIDDTAVINIISAIYQLGILHNKDTETITGIIASSHQNPFLLRFDESLDYLGHITMHESAFVTMKFPNGEHYAIARLGGPSSVQQEINRQLQLNQNVDEIQIQSSDEDAEFLSKAVQLLGFMAAKIRIQRTAFITEPTESIEFGNIRFDFTRRDRSIINHQLLSYGQKRLLAFYYYLACSPTAVVADELVNGMHHEWIEACMDDLEGRQAFLTSQNPLLLDYLHFESVDEVLSSFVLCRTEPVGEREQLYWENMTQEDAQGFFDAYQVGIQHVSEILHTRGLW
ncbi:AAA family ATPase [Pyxidicoccus trucidator]|uniref:AAA family ATPase n=1 Tax=Pyxidicoccus trucidator TaxID=2709662 RepID=UPI0013DA9E37|nr:AAA family ATPase [Pyxidicoccus trucidator]